MSTVPRISALDRKKLDDIGSSRSYLNVASRIDDRLPARERLVTPSLQSGTPIENRLLAALPRDEFRLLAGSLESVRYPKNRILYEAGDTMRHAIFINRGMACVLAATDDCQTVEVGTVGKEGFIGVPLILGADTACYRVIARTRVEAVKVESLVLREQFNRSDKLQQLLLHYTDVLETQTVQAVVCRVAHILKQRVARWLLMTSDCLDLDAFKVTHVQMATALGKHRNRVAVAVSELEKERSIESERGSIRIVDREALKAVACECYRTLREKMNSIGQV